MKKFILMIAVCLLTATASHAAGASEADLKWSKVVEKRIAAGSATISTPDENRAKLAQQLAAKYDRLCKVEKTETGYKVTVQAAEKTETAKN